MAESPYVPVIGSRRLLLQGKVNAPMQGSFTRHMLEFRESDSDAPIELLIDSGGGDGVLAEMMCDAIQACGAPVIGIAVGECHSSAFTILQHCTERRSWSHARFLFHYFTLPVERPVDQRFDTYVESTRRSFDEFIRHLQRRSHQRKRDLLSWAQIQRYWSAKEALEHGFIDRIVLPGRRRPRD